MRYTEENKKTAVNDTQVISNLINKQGREAFSELQSMIGLDSIKKMIWEVTAFALVQCKRSEEHLNAEPIVLHMIFKGNPGTGKTTIARILGKIFHDLDFLSKGHLVEVERADMVGEYIGHTAQKTREQIKKSLGGILFIDEAYTLAQGGGKDFGKEAIATLVKAMEDHRDNLIVILAGYSEEMDKFIKSNPGVQSRFPIQIEFPDYDADELFNIAISMLEKRQYDLTGKARWKLKNILTAYCRSRQPHGGNARYVRNLIEKVIRLQAVRLVNDNYLSRKDLLTIEECDLPNNI